MKNKGRLFFNNSFIPSEVISSKAKAHPSKYLFSVIILTAWVTNIYKIAIFIEDE